MNWFLVNVLGFLTVLVTLACLAALFARHRLHRRNRPDPKVATGAPLRWMADPRSAARLHRRLVHVGQTAGALADAHREPKRRFRPGVTEQPHLVELAEELRRQAVVLDAQLTRASMLPSKARRAPIGDLAQAVATAEQTCVRLVSVSAQTRSQVTIAGDPAGDITDVAGQAERLAEAHRLLREIDASVGLAPSPTTSPTTSPST